MKLDSNFQVGLQIFEFEKNAPKLELKGLEIEESSSYAHLKNLSQTNWCENEEQRLSKEKPTNIALNWP